MKKLLSKWNTLTEPQQIAVMVAPLPLTALVASVALLTTYIDFMSALFIVTALLFIGSIATGVVVAIVKDEERIIAQREGSRRLNAQQAQHRDQLSEAECDAYSLVNLLRIVIDPTHEDYLTAITDLNGFTAMGSQGMDDEGLIWYASAIWNGEGYSSDDLNRLDRMREVYEIAEPVRTEKEYTETAYTASASTALYFGTLDKAYEVNGETRYPLA